MLSGANNKISCPQFAENSNLLTINLGFVKAHALVHQHRFRCTYLLELVGNLVSLFHVVEQIPGCVCLARYSFLTLILAQSNNLK